jgi:hypothetical protein
VLLSCSPCSRSSYRPAIVLPAAQSGSDRARYRQFAGVVNFCCAISGCKARR